MLPGDWRSTINAARVCWMRYASRPGSPIGNDHRNVPTSGGVFASHQHRQSGRRRRHCCSSACSRREPWLTVEPTGPSAALECCIAGAYGQRWPGRSA
jgi:hypothetical protein